jgi:hypothetical protein
LCRAPLEGSLVTADARLTRAETARIIVQERGATISSPSKAIKRASPTSCNHSTRTWHALFPPPDPAVLVQTCERNRSRTETRCLIAFDTTAEAVGFPVPAGVR